MHCIRVVPSRALGSVPEALPEYKLSQARPPSDVVPVSRVDQMPANDSMPLGLYFPPCCTCVLWFDRMPAELHFPPCRTCVSPVDQMPANDRKPPGLHFPPCRTCLSWVDRMPAVLFFPPYRTSVFAVDRMPYTPIGNCDTSSVANRKRMFQNNIAFNQPIGDCQPASLLYTTDTSRAANMRRMFLNTNAFN